MEHRVRDSIKLPSKVRRSQTRDIGMGKLGTILFEKDDGPASSLLMSGSMDDHFEVGDDASNSDLDLDVEQILGEGKEMADSLMKETTANPRSSLRKSKTTESSPRTVRFADDINTDDEDKNIVDENVAPSNAQDKLGLSPAASLGKGDVLARVMELQSANKELKSQLESEKRSRKKKEKNVIKVAQALNRRSDEIKRKDAQILKMAEYIAQSKAQLSAVEDQLKQIQQGQSQKDQDLQQELLDAQTQIKRLEAKLKAAENMDLSPVSLRSSSKSNDAIHKALKDNITVQKKTPVSLDNSSSSSADEFEKGTVTPTTTTADDAVTSTTTTIKDSPSTFGATNPITIFLVVASVLIAMLFPLQFMSGSAFTCSPIAPGTELLPDPRARQPLSMYAPYWAPGPFKPLAYLVACGKSNSPPRSSMTWYPDKQELSISEIGNSKSTNVYKAPGGVAVSEKSLTLYEDIPTTSSSNGLLTYTAQDLPAPWAN